MVRQCDNIQEFLKKSFVFVLAFVLLFEIAPVKNIITSIFGLAENSNILVGLNLSDIIQIRKWALIYLILCIICFPLIKLYLLIRKHLNSPKNLELNPFEDSLYKYIEDKPNGKGYLVTGEWGSGKTYLVTESINKYYKFSNKSIYRISCFGLDSRKLILDEIKNQIEINDKSLLNWIQYIPAIGKPLFGILKDSYSLNSIPNRSVFIFDDFERITSLGITDNKRNKSYEKDKFILKNFNREPQFQEFKDINKEFTKIENAFRKYDSDNEIISLTNNLQKYNIVTGLINELIENYNIKVIIICNVDILGYDFVDKVFRGKLDCITYNKSIDGNSIESIFKSTIKNQIYSNKDVKRLVTGVTSKIMKDFEKVWFSSGNSNLRQAKSVVQAFFDTVNIISSKIAINENYLVSLFYSIYVVRVLGDENRLENLDQFLVGGNLPFFLHLYRKEELYESLTLSDNFSSLKWTGISIAGFWILNMRKPNNIDIMLKYYTDYEYNDLELTLLQTDSYSWNDDRLLLEHAMYVARKEANTSPEKHDEQLNEVTQKIRSNIGFFIEHGQRNEDSMEKKVCGLLRKIATISGGMFYSVVRDEWFKSIYAYSKVESVIEEEGIYILRAYNEFVQQSKNTEEQPINIS
ncbi:P-loop NTPase fold protein [Virgibacillus sp. C22-A2]|uniref:P-loop NTPase fold protein n=1 Tax=Virgibacillus tibetensis TaxID=3042313 RepID=A0ABU6KL05_9BACI|nr:P-loop NTPase fold protein [Virgibacillus sp. C22-A2]